VTRRSKRVCLAPLAVASDGSLLINMAEFQDDVRVEALVSSAKATGLVVFVAVVVPDGFREQVRRDLADAATDMAGRLGPKVVRARRPRA